MAGKINQEKGPVSGKAGITIPGYIPEYNYIIAIGIDKYLHDDFEDFVNDNCAKDCHDFVACMEKNYREFSSDNKKLINQEATKANIEAALKSFKKSVFNNENSNLILFFSGHGHVIKINEVPLGALVPHDCGANDLDEYLTFEDIVAIVRKLSIKNFLLVVDACKSGQAFNEQVNAAYMATQGESLIRSSWAVVSSRSDQNSKAGGKGENSFFTKKLLSVLSGNTKSEFKVEEVIVAVNELFSQEGEQIPFGGRYNVMIGNNLGHYTLRTNQAASDLIKIRQFLKKGLLALNYDRQFDCFPQFRRANKIQLAIFRGTPESGLKLLASHARSYIDIPSECHHRISVIAIKGTGEEKILNTFNAALDTDFTDLISLANFIHGQLCDDGMLIELYFYSEDIDKNGPVLREDDKKQFLNELTKLILMINNGFPDGNTFRVFIIDEENFNYSELIPGGYIDGVEAVVLPEIEIFNEDKADVWYTRQSQWYENDEKKEFKRLFDEPIKKNLPQIISDAKGYPATVIRRICAEVSCPDLAEDILK